MTGTDDQETFRVAVVVTLTVSAVDFTDAVHVAEGAVKNALRRAERSIRDHRRPYEWFIPVRASHPEQGTAEVTRVQEVTSAFLNGELSVDVRDSRKRML